MVGAAILISWKRKIQLREARSLDPGLTASEWWSWVTNPVLDVPNPLPSPATSVRSMNTQPGPWSQL